MTVAWEKSSTCFYDITIHLVKNTTFTCAGTWGGSGGGGGNWVPRRSGGFVDGGVGAREPWENAGAQCLDPSQWGFGCRTQSEGAGLELIPKGRRHPIPTAAKPMQYRRLQCLGCLCRGLHPKAGDFGGYLAFLGLRSPGSRLCPDFCCSFWVLSSELLEGFCP